MRWNGYPELVGIGCSLLFLLATLRLHAQEAPLLKLANTIPLPGVKGRFDHGAMDAKGGRLFVAALGNNTLEVIDAANGKRLKSVTGLHKPTGVAYLADRNFIGVANGDDGTFKVFSGDSYELVQSISSLSDADNVRYDPAAKLIYVGYGDGALAVIDSVTMKQTASIKLAAHPESFQLEQHGNRIFVNVPDAKHVAVIDRDRKVVSATWPMTEFRANFPMALDEENHRLFVGCRHPARLVVLDSVTGKPAANVSISDDTDDLFYDANRKRLYVSCGEGAIDVISQGEGDAYRRVAVITTRGGARTSFYSPDLDAFYLAVPMRSLQNAEIRVFRGK